MAAPVEEGMVAATVEEEGAVASSEEERRGRRREMDGAVALEKERRRGEVQTEGVEADADLSCEVHVHDICRGSSYYQPPPLCWSPSTWATPLPTV